METSPLKPLARANKGEHEHGPSTIRFGTDGWRAIIGEGFTVENLARVAQAAAMVYREDHPAANAEPQHFYVGYDCRENADSYAALAGLIVASNGFKVLISGSYCPTPTLCWSVAQDPSAVGGLIITASHNPAEFLGVKLRMADGGASPQALSGRVETALRPALPEVFEEALAFVEANRAAGAEAAGPDSDDAAAGAEAAGFIKDNATAGVEAWAHGSIERVDLMTPYLDNLVGLVDSVAIASAQLRVVVDPMFGAGRGYLADTLRSLGVEVLEIHAEEDSSFGGLHPEPILPWIESGLTETARVGYDASFFTDGDADRIGAGTRTGSFVNPHKILALVCALLVEDRGQRGRVVRTLSGSNFIKRQCERLGLELSTTPIGFKWIYEEMLKGDVLVGGEESGGIGIPSHVRERDGLLMTLLLTELMAKKGKDLEALVDDMLATLGHLEYERRDLRLPAAEKEAFLQEIGTARSTAERAFEAYRARFEELDEHLVEIDYRDGIKFSFASDAWLLARPSGTESLVRVYAESETTQQLERLLALGCALVKGE